MSMLTEPVPESLIISGTEYKINTEHSVWIKFEQKLSEDTENSEKVFDEIKKLIFVSDIPPSYADEETVEQIIWFYNCGKEIKNSGSGSSKEVFSYDFDDGFIYAAFIEQYKIDLERTKLHWWKFHALMLALPDSTEFVKVIGYRSVEITSKMSSEQRAFYQKMKKHYKLPVKKEIQDKYNAIEEALLNGEPIDNLL